MLPHILRNPQFTFGNLAKISAADLPSNLGATSAIESLGGNPKNMCTCSSAIFMTSDCLRIYQAMKEVDVKLTINSSIRFSGARTLIIKMQIGTPLARHAQ